MRGRLSFRPNHRLRIAVWLLSLLFAPALSHNAAARADTDGGRREDQFKAAYLYNFMKFVEWPVSTASSTLTVCFRGADGVLDALNAGIESKRIGTHGVVARRLGSDASLEGCNVLYIDSTAAAEHPPEMPALLTVSDAASFADAGGMIELFTQEQRLRFLINVQSAQHAGLRISSDLLKLAAGVTRDVQ